jgi:hypothetical protein
MRGLREERREDMTTLDTAMIAQHQGEHHLEQAFGFLSDGRKFEAGFEVGVATVLLKEAAKLLEKAKKELERTQ